MFNDQDNHPNIASKDLLLNNVPNNTTEESQLTMQMIRKGMIDATLSSVFYSINTINIKYTSQLNPNIFTSFNFMFWRGLTSTIVLYYIIKREDTSFTLFTDLKSKYWLSIRAFGFYVSLMFFIISLQYIRVSIAQVLYSIDPVVSLIVAVIILNEKFYLRYLIGILLCFIGSAIIVLNERGNNDETAQDSKGFYIGIAICVLNIFISGYMNISQKVLIDLGMSNRLQVFYVSLSLLCCSTVMCLLTWNFGFTLTIILFSTLNGVFFFAANHYAQESLKVLQIGGCVPFNYLQTIFVFGMCVVILKEPIFVTDIIGSLIIMSFHGYNSWNPIKE